MISTCKVVQLSFHNLQSCVSRAMFGFSRKRKNVLRVSWERGLDLNSTSGVALWTRPIHFGCQHLMVRVWFLQGALQGIVCWRLSTTSARSSASILWRKLQSNPFCGFLESTCIRSNTENYFRIVTTGLTFLFSGPIICDNGDEKKKRMMMMMMMMMIMGGFN